MHEIGLSWEQNCCALHLKLDSNIYITCTLNLGFRAAVFDREREHKRAKGEQKHEVGPSAGAMRQALDKRSIELCVEYSALQAWQAWHERNRDTNYTSLQCHFLPCIVPEVSLTHVSTSQCVGRIKFQGRYVPTSSLVGDHKCNWVRYDTNCFIDGAWPDTLPNAFSFQLTHPSANSSLHLKSGRTTVRDLPPMQLNGLSSQNACKEKER